VLNKRSVHGAEHLKKWPRLSSPSRSTTPTPIEPVCLRSIDESAGFTFSAIGHVYDLGGQSLVELSKRRCEIALEPIVSGFDQIMFSLERTIMLGIPVQFK
jgi:hypothetical protein